MKKITKLLKNYMRGFLDHLAKASLERNKTILDKTIKGLYI